MHYNHVITLSRTKGAGSPRFFADGVRISRDEYVRMKETACRLDSFHSTAKRVGSIIRHTDYVTAYLI